MPQAFPSNTNATYQRAVSLYQNFGSKKTNLSELALNLHEAIQFITILFQSKTVCKFLFYLFGHSQ